MTINDAMISLCFSSSFWFFFWGGAATPYQGKKNLWKRLGIKLVARTPQGQLLVKDFGRKLDKKVKKKGVALPENFLKQLKKEGILQVRSKLVSLKTM